jgi:hypothetical protein
MRKRNVQYTCQFDKIIRYSSVLPSMIKRIFQRQGENIKWIIILFSRLVKVTCVDLYSSAVFVLYLSSPKRNLIYSNFFPIIKKIFYSRASISRRDEKIHEKYHQYYEKRSTLGSIRNAKFFTISSVSIFHCIVI